MGIKVRKGGVWVEVSSGGGSGGSSDPVGTIVAWAGSVATIPSEYQLCDGGAASTSALQAITGANVPDLTDRFIVGANNVSGTGTYPGVGVGSTGGDANAVLIGHSHGTYGSESGYRHVVRAGIDAGFDWDSHTSNPNDAHYDVNSRTDATGQTAAGSSSTTQTGTNANLPPYYALCYIIKHTATSGGSGSGGSEFVLLSEQTATGTGVEFTGIPSDAMEITVMFKGVSASSNDDYLVQLGTSSGYITSGYDSSSEVEGGNSNVTSTTGFIIFNNSASDDHRGSMIINKASSNSYTEIGQYKRSAVGACQAYGSLSSVSGTIDRLKIRTESGGTNTFDAGTISVSYKTSGSGGSGSGGTDAGQGFFENDTTLNTSTTLSSNKNVGVFGPYTIGNNVTLTVPTGTTFTVV